MNHCYTGIKIIENKKGPLALGKGNSVAERNFRIETAFIQQLFKYPIHASNCCSTGDTVVKKQAGPCPREA